MSVDQTRQQRAAREVDHASPRGGCVARLHTYRCNAFPIYEHRAGPLRWRTAPIDQRIGKKQDRGGHVTLLPSCAILATPSSRLPTSSTSSAKTISRLETAPTKGLMS